MSENSNSNSGNNGMSIAGFIVSLCSLFLGLWGITGIVGIVLSAVGRNQASKDGSKTGLATAGIIIGIIGAGYCFIQLARLSAMVR